MSSIEEKLRLQKEERDKKAVEEKKARMAAAANRNTGAMALHQKVEQERLDRLNQERAAAEERVKERERANQLALEKAIKDEQERQEKMIRERKEKTEASAEARGQKNRAALERRDSALTEWKQKNEPLKEAEREQQLQKLYLARLERKTSSQQSLSSQQSPTSPRSHGVTPTSPRSHGVQFTTPSASTPTTTPSSEPSPTDDSSSAKLPPMLGSGSVTNSSSKKLLTPKPKKSVMFSRTVAVQDGTPKAKKRLLDKHNKGLTEVGEEVLQYTTLKKLILGSNKLSSLPDNFTVLECLEILDLSSNDITEDEDGVANLQILSKMPLLHEVDFTGNQIYKLPVMDNLVILGLADNNLDAIPEEIFLFKKLSKLDLSHNHIQHLPNELFSLVTINVLILAYNDLVELPEEIGQLVNLKELNLDSNQLQELPDSIGALVNIEKINVANNALSQLPDTVFGDATLGQTEEPTLGWFKLQELNLSSNGISELPEDLFLLTGLKKLDLSSNSITTLSSEIELLYELTELLLPNNRLSSIPETLSGMALEKVNLSNNRLRSIPTPPTYLISLDLENNMLTALPDMSNMEYLQELFISGNPIKEIGLGVLDGAVQNWENLEELDLSVNCLVKIPEELGNLPCLQWLSVHHNRLLDLPQSLAGIEELTSLDASSNLIVKAPKFNPKVEVNLSDNPIEALRP